MRFWKNDSLVRVLLCRFSCIGEYPKGHVGSLARILSAFSTRPSLVGCSGCPLDLLELLMKSKLFEKGIVRPFRFESVKFTTLLPNPTPCVFGNINFYSVIQYLVVFLGGARQQPWLVESPELLKVVYIFFLLCSFVYTST